MDAALSGSEPLAAASTQDWFRLTDGGRASSTRPRQKKDCTVRALAVACGVSYDDAHAVLAAAGRATGKRYDFRSYTKVAELNGNRFEWLGFPATKGERRMDPERFAATHPRGRYILRTAKHVLACVDGIIFDDMRPCSGRCVYGAWAVVEVTKARKRISSPS